MRPPAACLEIHLERLIDSAASPTDRIGGPFAQELHEQIMQIGNWFDFVRLSADHDAVENRGRLTAVVAA